MPTADAELAGTRVLVTRPALQAANLVALIRAAGAEPVPFPTLAIEPLAPDAVQLEALSVSDTVIFVSANAATYGYPLVRELGEAGLRIAAVGRATARTLEQLGCREVYTPAQSTSEGLLASPFLQAVAGRSICIVRGQGGREALKQTLTSRGARVSYLECYRRRRPSDPDTGILARALDDEHTPLMVSTTSVAGLVNLIAMAPEPYRLRLLACPLVVIGGRQKDAAREHGWTGPVIESGAGDAEIVAAIVTWRKQT